MEFLVIGPTAETQIAVSLGQPAPTTGHADWADVWRGSVEAIVARQVQADLHWVEDNTSQL